MHVRWLLAAFAIAATLVAAQLATKRADTLQPDELTYLSIVQDLQRNGMFTNGEMVSESERRQPGRFFAPAYPGLLHGLATLDPALADAIACHLAERERVRGACGSLVSLLILQVVLAGVGLAAVFAIALTLSGSLPVAWMTMLIALASGVLSDYARLFLTENIAFPAFLVALACLVALFADSTAGNGSDGSTRLWQAIAAGAALGIAVLARPSFLYLAYACAIVLALLALWPGQRRARIGWAHAGLFALACLGALLPWLVRNYSQFGDMTLTTGYAPFTLAQRVAYNAMTWQEWWAAWIFWFPDIGDDLAKALLPPEATARLGFNEPETFYKTGVGPVFSDTLAAAGDPRHHLSYIMKTHVVGDLGKHVAVTFPLAWRGMWPGKWIAVAGVLLLLPAIILQRRSGRLVPFLALAAPLFFMLGLHAFASVNVVRYNAPMIALYAFAIAICIAQLVPHWRAGGVHATTHAPPGAGKPPGRG